MKILIRNSDHVVVYAQPDLALTDTEASGDGWRDPNFTTANATMGEADLPPLWTGAVWTYIGGVWTVLDTARHALLLQASQKEAVPSQVTMRQARLALLAAGKLASVTAAINTLPSPQKEAAQIEWEYSQTVERNRGFVLLLSAALGLTDAQLDALFVTAARL